MVGYVLRGRCIGIAPILFNRFTEEAQDQMEKRKGGIRKTAKQKEENAYDKTWKDENGLFLPGINLRASLIEGSKKLGQKRGPARLWAYLRAILFAEQERFYFGADKPDGIDKRPGRNPNQKSVKVVIYRPYLKVGWTLPFAFRILDETPPEQIREALEFGGLTAVLGIIVLNLDDSW